MRYQRPEPARNYRREPTPC